jgi:hypothetical protein
LQKIQSPHLTDLVVYHTSHFLRGRDPKKHAIRIKDFLECCTVNVEFTELGLQVRSGPPYDVHVSARLIRAFESEWGTPRIEVEGGGSTGLNTTHTWSSPQSLDNLLAIVGQHKELSKAPLPMVSVSLRASFTLADIETKLPLASQNWGRANYQNDFFFLPHGFSEIWADLGESSAIGALISFPFAADDPKFSNYLRRFQSFFPTRMSHQTSCWHWWRVRKDGKQHYRRGAVPGLGGTTELKTLLSSPLS